MFVSRTRNSSIAAVLAVVLSLSVLLPAAALGPLVIEGKPAVSIYRDFDDGLYGRSIYRGVVFSVKVDSFGRYVSLPVRNVDGITAYLVSSDRADALAGLRVPGVRITDRNDPALNGVPPLPVGGPVYEYRSGGIEIFFSLESPPESLLDEIDRTYPGRPDVAREVRDAYRSGSVVRILRAENVYRPEYLEIDYEDVLIAASFVGDRFQPLWGIHDGNGLSIGPETGSR